MMVTGASNNFVSSKIIEKLGKSMTRVATKIKVVNSIAQPVKGSAKITLHVGNGREDAI